MSRSPYTTPIDALTFDDVVAFCDQQLKENIRLEYKETFSSKDAGKQIAKEVCAFANTQGGLLIFGVAEQRDRLPEKRPEGRPLGENARDRVIQACHANIFPPVVPEISEFLPNPVKADCGFLVIRVAASPEIPHTMEDGRRVYVRVYDKSGPVEATVMQIEHLLEHRKARVSLQAERMDRGINRLVSALGVKRGAGSSSGGFIAVGIGPVIMDAPDTELSMKGARAVKQAIEGQRWSYSVSSVVDGLYSIVREPLPGWLVDDYGNIVFASPGEWIRHQGALDSLPSMYSDWLQTLDKKDSQVAEFKSVYEPLCWAIDAAWRLCGLGDFVGLLRLKLVCESLLTLPLACPGSFGWNVLAMTRADTSLEFAFDFASSDFGPEGWNASLQAASRLLRGWGADPRIKAHDSLDMAERSIFGETACDCDPGPTHNRPRNHERCMRYRMQTAEAAPLRGSSG